MENLDELTKAALDACDAAGMKQPSGPLYERFIAFQEGFREAGVSFNADGDPWESMRLIKAEGSDRLASQIARSVRAMEPLMAHLPHLSFRDGRKLACFITDEGFASCSQFHATDGKRLYPLPESLVLDGSPESYWEAVLLFHASSQFWLDWHACNKSENIVCDFRRFLMANAFFPISSGENFDCLSPENQKKLLEMDFLPEVKFNRKTVSVSYVVTDPSGNFRRIRVRIPTNGPYHISKVTEIETVYSNCVVMF